MRSNRKSAALVAAGILIGSTLSGGTVSAATGVLAERSTMPFFVNGSPAEVEAYLIDGSNYLKLRDIATLADFGVFWNEASGTVSIDTTVGYTPEKALRAPTPSTNYSAAVNPAALIEPYTREACNALRQTIVTGAKSDAIATSDTTRTAMEEVTAVIGMWPVYERKNSGNGTSYFTAKYPDAYQEAAAYCRSFIDSLTERSDREKVRQIAFFVCDRLEYSADASPTPRTVLVSDAVSRGNCVSYARNFQFLCEIAGIPCILVHSDRHQWNEVYVESTWWSVDVGGTDVSDVSWRADLPVLHETFYLQGATYVQAQSQLTLLGKELLVPGSTR